MLPYKVPTEFLTRNLTEHFEASTGNA